MRVAVIGATGQLGTDLIEQLDRHNETEPVALEHSDVEVTDLDGVRQALHASEADAVINCAAYHRVDDCEDAPLEAFSINAFGAHNVSRACADVGAASVFISSDYVFAGDKGSPYTESDPIGPRNVYGASKVAGELLSSQPVDRSIVARVASLFGKAGPSGKGNNFVETMLAKAKSGDPLTVVDDQFMSPTYTFDAAGAIVEALLAERWGVHHMTNAGGCSWFQFAQKIFELTKIDASLSPTKADQYKTKARRPSDSRLTSTRTGDSMPPWEDALERYLTEMKHI